MKKKHFYYFVKMSRSLHFEMFEKFVFWGHPVLTTENKSELESHHHIYIDTRRKVGN